MSERCFNILGGDPRIVEEFREIIDSFKTKTIE